MILHTIISPEDIFYQKPSGEVKNVETFSTDPYYYLNKDEYYKQYVQQRNRFPLNVPDTGGIICHF